MSSPLSDKPPEEGPHDDRGESHAPAWWSFVERWWSRVEPWRRLMLGGALILLTAAILQAWLEEDFPDQGLFVANFGGYLLLALGFAQFFRDRRNRKR
jgi:hypothetical protein